MPDGSNFTSIFACGSVTPDYPNLLYSDLYYDGTYLYGASLESFSSGFGIVFRIKPDGTQYTNLLEFTGDNGAYPYCALVSDGTYLYGTTENGGHDSRGVVFKIKKDGTGYQKLYQFMYPDSNGKSPECSLLYDGTYLYGTTWAGGINEDGVIFKIKTDGTGFTKVHDFNNVAGGNPMCTLISDGTYLYGNTVKGGSNNQGVAFRVKLDGTAYQVLVNFDTALGQEPLGQLTLIGNYIYGITSYGGSYYDGTIFKIKKDGSAFIKLADFPFPTGYPYGGLLSLGGYLYGTSKGGNGTVYRIDTNSGVASLPTSMLLYPNPNNGVLNFKVVGDSSNQYMAEIFNVLGQKIYTKTFISQLLVELPNQQSGVYLYRVVNGQGKTFGKGKFVIAK